MALHYNFDTRDDCSKRVQLAGAYRVQRMMKKLISRPGKNRGMHPHRVQLLQAEVSVHPHRVQTHPVLVHFGDYDGVSYIEKSAFQNRIQYRVILSLIDIGIASYVENALFSFITQCQRYV